MLKLDVLDLLQPYIRYNEIPLEGEVVLVGLEPLPRSPDFKRAHVAPPGEELPFEDVDVVLMASAPERVPCPLCLYASAYKALRSGGWLIDVFHRKKCYEDETCLQRLDWGARWRLLKRAGFSVLALDAVTTQVGVAVARKGEYKPEAEEPRELTIDDARRLFKFLLDMGAKGVPVGSVLCNKAQRDLDFVIFQTAREPEELARAVHDAFVFPVDLIFPTRLAIAKTRFGVGRKPRVFTLSAKAMEEFLREMKTYESLFNAYLQAGWNL